MTSSKRWTSFLALIFFLEIASNAGWGQAGTPAQLPPAAQQALDKGIAAARVPDYPLAISLFQSARTLAPTAPVIYLNLGLAESKIPGRELRAIAWFGAYLAAYPNAPNAEAVKAVIGDLDTKNQNNISRLIKSEQDFVIQRLSGNQSSYIYGVAVLYADAGNIPAALATTDLIQDETYRGYARAATAAAQAKARRTEAEVQMASGNTAGARQILASSQTFVALISDTYGKRLDAQLALAQAQMRAGDTAGARDSFVAARKIADAFDAMEKNLTVDTRDSDKATALTSIAEAQAKAGDAAAARETLEAALKTATLIQDAFSKTYRLVAVAEAQAATGDFAGASKAAELFGEPEKTWALLGIARAQAQAGDVAGALKTGNLPKSGLAAATLVEIAEAQIKAGNLAGAQESLKAAQRAADRNEDAQDKVRDFIRIAEALRKAGDIAGANRTLIFAQRAADRVNKASGLNDAGASKLEAQAEVLRTRARVSAVNFATFDWLEMLDDDGSLRDYSNYFFRSGPRYPLGTAPFLNLASHLGTAPPADTAQAALDYLHKTTENIIAASNSVREMMKQQTGK